ncbi:MAG: hypothetical protein ACOY0T_30315 [Myxococcota bacterium]
MDLRSYETKLVGALAGLCAFASAAHVLAAPCPNLPNPIYGSGGSAATATIGRIAAALRGLPEPITVFYHDPGACIGFKFFVDYVKSGTVVNDAGASPTTVKYWEADGTQRTCDAPTTLASIPLDFSHMGNEADFCEEYRADGLPAGFADFVTPVQTLNIITDKDSSQKSISAEALYYIWGLGAVGANIQPWTDPTKIVLRTVGSFAHQFPATAVFGADEGFTKVFYDHPSTPGRLGVAVSTNGASISAVVAGGATNPDATLGYASGNAVDAATASVKTLAYQHFGQTCGYWPSSSDSAQDKINVRRGNYALWTPGHLYAPVDANKNVVIERGANASENAAIAERVATFIGLFAGTLDSPAGVTPPILERIIRAGDIPLCAMEVAREGTLGPIRSQAPTRPCGCYFEAIATGNASSCRACSDDNGCEGSQHCRFGYCEAY